LDSVNFLGSNMSLTWGAANVMKAVIPSSTLSTDFATNAHCRVIMFPLCLVINYQVVTMYQLAASTDRDREQTITWWRFSSWHTSVHLLIIFAWSAVLWAWQAYQWELTTLAI